MFIMRHLTIMYIVICDPHTYPKTQKLVRNFVISFKEVFSLYDLSYQSYALSTFYYDSMKYICLVHWVPRKLKLWYFLLILFCAG